MPRRTRRADALRAVGLIRVSKVGARGDDLLSPDLQRTAIRDYAAARGMDVIEWVEALDESGSQDRSPWWRRLDQVVARVEAGELDAILVWKFSRAARHRRKWAVALDRVEVAGGVLESATEQLDTSTSTGRLARGMLAELAAWEAEVKGEQWREVAANRLARGLPSDGRPRWGYTYTRTDGYVPDPDESPLVREAYERYLAGDGFVNLVRWLDRQGSTNRNGQRWTATDLRRAMDSGFGAGWLSSQVRERSRGAHEAVVPLEVFQAYERARARRARRPPRVESPTHPLAGLMRCGTCRGPMCRGGRSRPAGTVLYDFRCCHGATRGEVPCPGAQISERRVHAAVREWLEQIASEVDVRAAAVASQRRLVSKARRDSRAATVKVAKLDAALAHLTEQFALGEVPAEAYRTTRDRLTAQRDEAAAVAEEAQEVEDTSVRPSATTARSLLGSWDELVAGDPAGLRDVLAALISSIVVLKGDPWSTVVVVPRWESAGF